jgi:hypothetical protein
MNIKNLALCFVGVSWFCQSTLTLDSVNLNVTEGSYTFNSEKKSFAELSQSLKSMSLSEIELSVQGRFSDEDNDNDDDNQTKLEKREEKLLSDFLSLKVLRNTLTFLSISKIELNPEVSALVNSVEKLKVLSFEDCSIPVVTDENSFSRLTNLTKFSLTNSSFEHDIDKEIPLNGIVNSLRMITSLTSLDFEGSRLFPPVKKQREFGRKNEDKIALEHYMSWRKVQIDQCAQLLISNHCIRIFNFKETEIGGLFVDALAAEFVQRSQSRGNTEINFSNNNIPLDNAVEFSIQLGHKNIKVNFEGNKGENDRRIYTKANIHQGIVAHFLPSLEFDQD